MTTKENIFERRNLRRDLIDYLFIAAGIALYSVGYCAFILPEHFVMGGVSGINALLFYAWKIPPALSNIVINTLLLVIAWRALSKQFAIRTIVGVVLISSMVGLMQPLFEAHPIITPGQDGFMHLLIGALLGGAGLGLAFSRSGSTGGTDIILALINRYYNISMGRAMQLVDICIICSSYLLFHSVEIIIYGVMFTLISSVTLDYIFNGSRQTVQFLIISRRYKDIADAVNKHMDRGVTILHGEGWFSKQPVEVVMVLARKYESRFVFNIIKSVDPNAMVSQSFCHGVFGEGFDKIK